MGAPAPHASFDRSAPEPIDMSTKPNRGQGIPIPGLAANAPSIPTPPAQPRSPTPPTPEMRSASPIRVAMPVGRGAADEVTDVHDEQTAPPPAMPTKALNETIDHAKDADEDPEPDLGRAAAQAAATATMGEEATEQAPPVSASKGKTAVVQYDYDADESNEISLKEGEHVTDIDMVDDDWWMGTNAEGQSGLNPRNYVKLVEDGDTVGGSAPEAVESTHAAVAAPPAPPAGPAASEEASGGATATSIYDYEAAESNEISFPEGAKITNIVRQIPPRIPDFD